VLKRYSLIIFSLTILQLAGAQSIGETLEQAHELFGMEEYDGALKLFRRIAWFGDDQVKAEVYPYIAKCYLYKGDYHQSIFFFRLSSNTTSSDSLFNEYALARALCEIILDNHGYALQELFQVNPGESEYFIRKYHFFLGVVYLRQDNIPESQLHFLSASNNQYEYNAIIDAYNAANLNRPNPGTARFLSVIIPGAGQLYSGDTFNAANSFILNSLLVTILIRMALKQTFIDAAMGIGPWLQRYYTGGFTNAGKIARNRKISKREGLLLELYSIFEENNNISHQ
jgi:hypothetical protein